MIMKANGALAASDSVYDVAKEVQTIEDAVRISRESAEKVLESARVIELSAQARERDGLETLRLEVVPPPVRLRRPPEDGH